MNESGSRLVLVLAIGFSTLCSVMADSAVLPSGGVNIVDMYRVTRERSAQDTRKSSNILPASVDGWYFVTGANRGSVPGKWNKEWQLKERSMTALLRHSAPKDPAGSWSLTTPETIDQHRTSRNKPIFIHRLRQKEPLKVSPGEIYTFSYELQGHCPPRRGRFTQSVEWLDKNGKTVRKLRSKHFFVTPGNSWQKIKNQIIIPDGAAQMQIVFALYDIGSVQVRNFALSRSDAAPGYEMKLFPMGMLDNEYHIARNQVNFIGFLPRNLSRRPVINPRLKITLPAGIKVLGIAPYMPQTMQKNQNPDGTVTYIVEPKVYYWERTIVEDFGGSYPVQLAVTSALPPGKKRYKFTYQALADGYAAPEETAYLQVISPLSGEQPKYFQSGIYDHRAVWAEPEVYRQFAREYKAMGFNSMLSFNCPEYMTGMLHQQGIFLFGNLAAISNGFAGAPAAEKRPEYTHFIGADGQVVKDYNGRFNLYCPLTVIQRTEYYKTVMLEQIRSALKERDHLSSNWEPGHAQTSGGCFCDRCREDFIRYSKLPASEVQAAWPENILGKYRRLYMEFKSDQHGRYLSTLENDINAIAREMGKNSSGFMPRITRDLMLDSQFNLTDTNAFAVRFYADKIKWINGWGPYLGQHWSQLKRELPGSRIRMLTMARSVVRYMQQIVPDPAKRPRLLAFPIGLCVNMLTVPEYLKMDTLSIYAAGWHGSLPYYFPSNYDARYWQKLAEANTLIARTEDVVMQGERLTAPPPEIISPYPAGLYAEINAPEKPISSLQTEYFRKGNRFLLAAGNFWNNGEVFFKVKFTGLPAVKYFIIKDVETGNIWVNDKKQNFSSAELSQGITLHAGALRWVFYQLTATDTFTPPPGKYITPQLVSQTMQQRLPSLQAAWADENKFVKTQAKPVESPSRTDLLDKFKAPGIEIKVRHVAPAKTALNRIHSADTLASGAGQGHTQIIIRNQDNVWTVIPDQGACVTSWRYKDRELSYDQQKLGIGRGGSWGNPASIWSRPFDVSRAEAVPGGAAIEFKRTLNSNDHVKLDGLQVTVRMEFTHNKLKISTRIKNAFNDTVKFAYRYQNVFGLLQNMANHAPGKMFLTTPDGEIQIGRVNQHRFFRMQGVPPDDTMTKRLFKQTRPAIDIITSSAGRITSADGALQLNFNLTPAADFHGFAVFAGGAMQTLEPIFNACELPVGQEKNMIMELEVTDK